jgi:hypothetical protein
MEVVVAELLLLPDGDVSCSAAGYFAKLSRWQVLQAYMYDFVTCCSTLEAGELCFSVGVLKPTAAKTCGLLQLSLAPKPQ